MIDNDCDGQTDEDGVCPLPMCAQDDQEPNDSVTTGFAMSINQPLWGFTCQGDMEFFALPVLTAGSTYRINVAFPHSTSDIDIKLYRNGSVWKSSDSVTDHEQITFTAAAGDTYVVEVDNLDPTASNFYRITLLKTWACGSDDAFESNDTISTASLLPQSWRASAYNCADNNDWYLLGRHASGVTLDVRAYFGTGLFGGGDIDMVLYGDSDGDNTYEPLVQANAGGSDEFLTHTTTFESLYFVRVFTYDPLDSNDYDIYWTK